MRIEFFRSLDRPIDIFGLKGRWIGIFLWGVGADLFLAIIIGSLLSAGIGICFFLAFTFAFFFGILIIQGGVSERAIVKVKASSKTHYTLLRKQTISFILQPDNRHYLKKETDK